MMFLFHGAELLLVPAIGLVGAAVGCIALMKRSTPKNGGNDFGVNYVLAVLALFFFLGAVYCFAIGFEELSYRFLNE